MISFINNNKKEGGRGNGFTLIEMLVAVALFSIISTMAFTALYYIMDASTKTKTIKLVVNNLNMTLESMSREIRVGYDYTCNRGTVPISGGSDCGSGASILAFKTKEGNNAYFRYNSISKTIERKVSGKDTNAVSLIGDDVQIDKFKFYVTGTTTGNSTQPKVLMVLEGSTKRSDIDTVFNIQTTVSQRKLAP